jgi:uncharacterized membrane protein YcaP (DUF421 family)
MANKPVDHLRELVIHLLEENGFMHVVKAEEFSNVTDTKSDERAIWAMDEDGVEYAIIIKQGV